MAVHLPAVEDVLTDGVYGGEDGGERVEVFDGHPDAEGGVLLSEELSAGHLLAVAGADPFAEAELQGAEHDGDAALDDEEVPVRVGRGDDVVEGLAQYNGEGEGPDVEGGPAYTADGAAHLWGEVLEEDGGDEGEDNLGEDATDEMTIEGYAVKTWWISPEKDSLSYKNGSCIPVKEGLKVYAEWVERKGPDIPLFGLPGDANGDESLDMKDVLAMRKSLAGLSVSPYYPELADINEDGSVDMKDVLFLRKQLAGV